MFIRRCEKITKVVRCMTTEICDVHFYDGLDNINSFLEEYEEHVPECQILLALDLE